MEEVKTVDNWKTYVEPALISKAKEMQLMGYSEATLEGIWECLVNKVWKNNPSKRLYEIVQDIFHLNSTTYMSYLTVQSQDQEDDLLATINALNDPFNEAITNE
ncbi:post-transcriptional regulator [Virgibacillus sp. W0430]|uniref:post-transcriptional regulator n=1 Tax=Virgibacillus sp. W0430 TaxID=3391580 RepID=UPI003F471152